MPMQLMCHCILEQETGPQIAPSVARLVFKCMSMSEWLLLMSEKPLYEWVNANMSRKVL